MTDNRRPGSGQRPSQQPESNNATIPAPDQRPNTALSINTATAIQQRTTGYQPSPTSQNITSRIPGASPAAYEPTSTVASAPVLNAQNRLHPNPFPSALPSANSQRPPKTAITMMSASAVSSTQPRHHLSSIRATPTGLTSDSNRSRLVRLERTRTVHGIRQLEYAGLVPPGMLHRADRMMSRNGQCQRFWAIVAQVTTFWSPSYLMRNIWKMKDPSVRQAWREKFTLCLISFLMCAALGWFTFFFQRTVCPDVVSRGNTYSWSKAKTLGQYTVIIRGSLYQIDNWYRTSHPTLPLISSDGTKTPLDATEMLKIYNFRDLSILFADTGACAGWKPTPRPKCSLSQSFSAEPFSNINFKCHPLSDLDKMEDLKVGSVKFDWETIESTKSKLMVFNGNVVDLRPLYVNAEAKAPFTNYMDVIERAMNTDASILLNSRDDYKKMAQCLVGLYGIGVVDQETVACVVSEMILWTALLIISALILVRFILALSFSWVLSRQLGKIEEFRLFRRRNREDEDTIGTGVTAITHPQSFTVFNRASQNLRYKELYTICLVTAYSEGESGLRTTLDSLVQTEYPDEFKIIFAVADGVVKGAGNPKPTGEIILEMMELDPAMHGAIEIATTLDQNGQEVRRLVVRNAEPQSYEAVGQGTKKHNMARVYCGTYMSAGRKVPMVLVYKSGTAEEQTGAKPGNRGKRDSQIILMDFLSKPMSPFQYDLFTKMTQVMTVKNGGKKRVTPDLFEALLMVDADTQVAPDSLTHLISVLQRDPTVMGLCGETRIINKNESWVTMIQVFEYHVSHHLTKAFESVFGGVTCLPGCFCMYRIKTPKPLSPDRRSVSINPEEECEWVPILANPDIVADYSESVVDTLHKKNLLLLGEDRYLSTLMLRTFPRRKMMFVPKSYCKTQVPADFKVLLSQRRRWINSTIHNLLELVLVRELCGIFCFSMQFVVLMELIGTATLPAAICFTLTVIVVSIIGPVATIPLILLAGILGLPGLLIVVTANRPIYLFYMFIYILSLPIWNFALPVYAFWHFDDFSWGQTRMVAGEKKGGDAHGHGHGGSNGDEDDAQYLTFPRMRWVDWETERRRNLRLKNELDPVGMIPGSGTESERVLKTMSTIKMQTRNKVSSMLSMISDSASGVEPQSAFDSPKEPQAATPRLMTPQSRPGTASQLARRSIQPTNQFDVLEQMIQETAADLPNAEKDQKEQRRP